ncbi:MAG: DUF1489 family protein [Parvularculaceae bacterium]
MGLHLVKLCVGAETLDDLIDWVARRTTFNRRRGLGDVHDHVTRMFPRRCDELLAGGSMFWVIKGNVQARQAIRDLETETGEDGIARCRILLDPPLFPTEIQPRRAFQGWRYLKPEDAPRDARGARGVRGGSSKRGSPGKAAQDAKLRAELAELGLL